jgi:hypothetical protein
MVVLLSRIAVKRNRELLDGRWDKLDTKDEANTGQYLPERSDKDLFLPPTIQTGWRRLAARLSSPHAALLTVRPFGH